MSKILNRIKEWRDFRKDIKNLSSDEQILGVVNYWSKMPVVNFVLNYNEYDKWPTAWELITEGYFDSISIAYLMMETLVICGWNKDRFKLEYIKPDDSSEYIMVLIIDNRLVLNYSYNEVYNIDEYEYIRCIERYTF